MFGLDGRGLVQPEVDWPLASLKRFKDIGLGEGVGDWCDESRPISLRPGSLSWGNLKQHSAPPRPQGRGSCTFARVGAAKRSKPDPARLQKSIRTV